MLLIMMAVVDPIPVGRQWPVILFPLQDFDHMNLIPHHHKTLLATYRFSSTEEPTSSCRATMCDIHALPSIR